MIDTRQHVTVTFNLTDEREGKDVHYCINSARSNELWYSLHSVILS